MVSYRRCPNPGAERRSQRRLPLRLSFAEMVEVPRKERLVDRGRVFQREGTECAKTDGKE